jgi:hypothetical protein
MPYSLLLDAFDDEDSRCPALYCEQKRCIEDEWHLSAHRTWFMGAWVCWYDKE